MPYGDEDVQAAPRDIAEFNDRFLNEMALAEMGNEPIMMGDAVVRKRWGMVRSAVEVYKPRLGGNYGGLKPLDGEYELEALDEKHRMADMLSTMKRHYDNAFPPSFHMRRTLFLLWLDRLTEVLPNEVKRILKDAYGAKFPDSAYDAFVTTGVEYKTNPLHRFTNLITIRGGKMFKHWPGKKLFDTRETQTFFSGKGWAIFVVSHSDLWFAGSHLVGKLQHSSFLGGRPVKSAGEIQVLDGQPTVISAKSGHYKPTLVQFMNGLHLLKQAGVNMDALKVAVLEAGSKQKTLLTASSYLINTNLRNRYTVW